MSVDHDTTNVYANKTFPNSSFLTNSKNIKKNGTYIIPTNVYATSLKVIFISVSITFKNNNNITTGIESATKCNNFSVSKNIAPTI